MAEHGEGAMRVAIVGMEEASIESFRLALDVVARERRYLTLLEAPPLDEMRSFVSAGRMRGDLRFVAVEGDRVVGWCDIRRHDFPSHAHRGVLGMGVVPGFRGRGLGRRLLTTTLGAAWAAGITRVELDVHADNAPAMALYEKAGFVREGVIRDAACIDGLYRDAITMALVRRPKIPA